MKGNSEVEAFRELGLALDSLLWTLSFCSMSWIDQPIYFVDFEGNQTSGILEFGVATVLRGQVVEAFTRRCRPVGAIRAADTAVHGLAADELGSFAPFTDEWEFFASLRERGPLAAHFAGVENALLKSVWPYPRPSPDFARPGESVAEWGPWIDSARIYEQLYPTLPSRGLEDLIGAAGLGSELETEAKRYCPSDRCRYHAALYDALAGGLLLAALARDPAVASLSVMQLLALSTLDPVKRDALQQRELF